MRACSINNFDLIEMNWTKENEEDSKVALGIFKHVIHLIKQLIQPRKPG